MSASENGARYQQASILTTPIVSKYIDGLKTGVFSNPIRAMEHCGKEITETLAKEGFPSTFFPLMATLGDVDAQTFSRKLPIQERMDVTKSLSLSIKNDLILQSEIDPFESEFISLAYEMGFNEGFSNVKEEEEQIINQYQQEGINPFRYDTFARGTIEARKQFAKQAKSIGLENMTEENTWMVEGGMGGLKRVYENVNDYFEENHGRKARFLAPSVAFTMGVTSAKKAGLEITRVPTGDLPNQELTGERLKQFLEQGNTKADMLYLVLADNPRAMSADPEILRGVLQVAMETNPYIVFAFDMAYMKLIPEEKAKKIMSVVKETGADQRGYFVFTDSKRIGRPGSRYGAVVIPNNELGDVFQNYTMAVSPGYSINTDISYQALMELIDDEVINNYQKLLRKRQQALLEVLKDLDPDQKFFRNLDKIKIEGYYDKNALKDGDVVQDVPLYLWTEINRKNNEDCVDKCFEIMKELNIVGVPGTAFEDENHMRFSLGVVSTIDVLKKSPAVLSRWLQKFDLEKH